MSLLILLFRSFSPSGFLSSSWKPVNASLLYSGLLLPMWSSFQPTSCQINKYINKILCLSVVFAAFPLFLLNHCSNNILSSSSLVSLCISHLPVSIFSISLPVLPLSSFFVFSFISFLPLLVFFPLISFASHLPSLFSSSSPPLNPLSQFLRLYSSFLHHSLVSWVLPPSLFPTSPLLFLLPLSLFPPLLILHPSFLLHLYHLLFPHLLSGFLSPSSGLHLLSCLQNKTQQRLFSTMTLFIYTKQHNAVITPHNCGVLDNRLAFCSQ